MGRIEMLQKELNLNELALAKEPTYELLVQRSYLKDMIIEEYKKLLEEKTNGNISKRLAS